ncbi:DUF1080 domain-containing protein [soil metagenome]
MKMVTLSALFAFGITACGTSSDKSTTMDTTVSGDSTVTTAQSTSEILFDGSTLNGWHSYGKSEPGKAWNVDSGAIHLNASSKKTYQTNGGGDLVSNDEYENFDLQLDWKISKNGNSGIIFYVHEDTAKYKETWNTGLEMQVLDNDGHPDGKIPKHRAANLYDLIAASPENVKGPGEWNHAEIIANKGQLEFYLNGEKVVSKTLWNDDWKKMVAGSKFKDMPDWGTYTKGHIALQDHGNDVWYKNIMIKKL